MKYLNIMKIVAVVMAVITSPLLIFGWGLFITIPFGLFTYLTDKNIDSKTGKVSNRSNLYAITIFTGLASFFALYTLGAFMHLDSTTKVSIPFLVFSGLICLGITFYTIYVIRKLPVAELKVN